MMKKYYLFLILIVFLFSCNHEHDYGLELKPTIAEGIVTKIEVLPARGFTICDYEYYLTLDTGSRFLLFCGAWRNFGPVYIGQKIEIKELGNPGHWLVPYLKEPAKIKEE